MTNSCEQILFRWKTQIEDVKHILRYLETYPDVLAQLELDDIVSPSELESHQKAWVELCLSYDGMEKDFFQPSWVPISSASYDYFIDLSDSNYPIFEFHFQWFDPPCYIRANVFDSIEHLMLAKDKNIDILAALNDAKFLLYGFDE